MGAYLYYKYIIIIRTYRFGVFFVVFLFGFFFYTYMLSYTPCRVFYVSLLQYALLPLFYHVLSLGLFRNRGVHPEASFIGEGEKSVVFCRVSFSRHPPAAKQSAGSRGREQGR